jgi:hypothetical protein
MNDAPRWREVMIRANDAELTRLNEQDGRPGSRGRFTCALGGGAGRARIANR